MAAVKMPLGDLDFFPPSDRELSLRAQIKTGWSTVALRKEYKMAENYLPKNELKFIQDVLTRSEAFNRMEEIRIGVQSLKFKQMKESIRGNGTTTCLLCGFDFSHQRTRRPVPLQFCEECGKAMCPRCRVLEKHFCSGGTLELCRICYEERELWKKSGAWLTNQLPAISIPEEELMRFQQLKNAGKKVTLGRRDSAPKEFINPYQLEAEDSEDEDELSSQSRNSQIVFPYSSREGSPIPPSLITEGLSIEAGMTQSLPRGSRLQPQSKRSSLERPNVKKRSGTFSGELEDSVGQRRQAMGGAVKRKLSSSRRKVRQKRAQEHDLDDDNIVLDTPQIVEPVSLDAAGNKEEGEDEAREGVSPLGEQNVAVPTIRLRRPSTPNKSLNTEQHLVTEHNQAAAVESKGPKKIDVHFDSASESQEDVQEIRKVHQLQKRGSETDDSVIPVKGFDVTLREETSPRMASSSKRKPVPLPRKMQQSSFSDDGEEVSAPVPKPVARKDKKIAPHKDSVEQQRSPPRSQEKEASPPKGAREEWKVRTGSLDNEPSASQKGSRSPRQGSLDSDQMPQKEASYKERSPPRDREEIPPRKPTVEKVSQPHRQSMDIEWKKVATPPNERKQSAPSHALTTTPSPSASAQEDSPAHNKRQMLGDSGKQFSVTSTISNISTGSSFEDSLPPLQTQQAAEQVPKQSNEETVDLESSGGLSQSGGYNWRRRNAKRVTARGGEEDKRFSSDFSGAADDFEQPEQFRERSGGLSRVTSGGSVGEQSAPKKFQRTKSPLTVESQPRRGRAKSSSPSQESAAALAAAAAKKASQLKGKRQSLAAKSFDSRTHPDGSYGSVEVIMHLDDRENELKVTILRCNGLRAMDTSGYSDPYVKIFLVPGNKRYHFRTRVLYRDLNPEFNETFTFPNITKSSLERKELCLVVMDRDDFSADDLIGSTRIKFYELLESSSLSQSSKMILDDGCSMPFKGDMEDKERGKIELAIAYHAKEQTLVLSVLRAKHLTPCDSSSSCDPYVKCLWSSQNQCCKRKTKVCPKTVHPEFKEDLEFEVQYQDLAYSKMVVTVWNKNKMSKDHMIGEVQFSDPSFWKRFKKSSSSRVTDWYTVVEP